MMDYVILAVFAFLSATVLPLASETAYIPILLKHNSVLVLIWASIWNTLGSITTFYLGYLAKWEWIEKFLRVSKVKVRAVSIKTRKWGIWIGFFSWVPVVGDLFPLVMGFLKYSKIYSFILIFAGKFCRYLAVLISIDNPYVAPWLRQILGIDAISS